MPRNILIRFNTLLSRRRHYSWILLRRHYNKTELLKEKMVIYLTLQGHCHFNKMFEFYPHVRTSNGLIPRIFGCTSFVHVHSQNRGKLDLRAIKCVFLGYSSTQKSYKCYHHPSKFFYIFADATFAENKAYFAPYSLQGEISNMEEKDWPLIGPLDLRPILSPK